MKKLLNHFCLTALCAAVLLSCTPAKMHAKKISRSTGANATATGALASFGFYVYKEPADLSNLNLPPLAGGSPFTNADFTGNISLLNFWAGWCPPCRAEMPSIERLSKEMDGKNFKIVAVNVGQSKKEVADFIEKHKYTFPIYLDERGTVSAAFASRGIPITYVINKEGKIIAVRPGAMEYDQPELIKAFKDLADE